jgi:hypothetical protein
MDKNIEVYFSTKKITLAISGKDKNSISFTPYLLITHPPARSLLFEIIRRGGQQANDVQYWLKNTMNWIITFYNGQPQIVYKHEEEVWQKMKRNKRI